jgi:acetolactate synthase-1/2/3 large subunit
MEFCNEVKEALPTSEQANRVSSPYVNTYELFLWLSKFCEDSTALVPSSSGASETVAMQVFEQSHDITIITSKGLASMGYGLAGAVGAALSLGGRVIHVEGDGGFAQNLQELSTVKALNLNVKMFILDNDGYASIRMTQSSYFAGHYVGCDSMTGLLSPDWHALAKAYGIPSSVVDSNTLESQDMLEMFESQGAHIFVVRVDPNQTYFPKISSRVSDSGSMESNPLHLMTPELEPSVSRRLLRFLG